MNKLKSYRSSEQLSDWLWVERELQRITDEVGHFPTYKELGQRDRGLLSALYRHHDGYRTAKERMGYVDGRKPYGYLKDEENILKEILAIKERHGLTALPSRDELVSLGYRSLAWAINKGIGFRKIRALVGDKQRRVEDGTWDDKQYVLSQLRAALKHEGWSTIPGSRKMNERGYSALLSGMARHGTIRYFRELLELEQPRKENNWWKDENEVTQELRSVLAKEGWEQLPSHHTLTKKGYNHLIIAIKNTGGFHHWRALLGQKQKQRPHGAWKSIDYTLSEARSIMSTEGWDELPASATLSRRGYSSLVAAIRLYHGGLETFRRVLNGQPDTSSESKQLEFLLEQYAGGQNE